jgi:hypothetical protein
MTRAAVLPEQHFPCGPLGGVCDVRSQDVNILLAQRSLPGRHGHVLATLADDLAQRILISAEWHAEAVAARAVDLKQPLAIWRRKEVEQGIAFITRQVLTNRTV